MLKTRGAERRNWDGGKDWQVAPPKGCVERRRKAERRKPDLAEGSFEEFENLLKAQAVAACAPTALDQLLGHL